MAIGATPTAAIMFAASSGISSSPPAQYSPASTNATATNPIEHLTLPNQTQSSATHFSATTTQPHTTTTSATPSPIASHSSNDSAANHTPTPIPTPPVASHDHTPAKNETATPIARTPSPAPIPVKIRTDTTTSSSNNSTNSQHSSGAASSTVPPPVVAEPATGFSFVNTTNVESNVPFDESIQAQLAGVIATKRDCTAALMAAFAKRPKLVASLNKALEAVAELERDQLDASEREDFDRAAALEAIIEKSNALASECEQALLQHDGAVDTLEHQLRGLAAHELGLRSQLVDELTANELKLQAVLKESEQALQAEAQKKLEELQAEEDRIASDKSSWQVENQALDAETSKVDAKVREESKLHTEKMDGLKQTGEEVAEAIRILEQQLEAKRAEERQLQQAMAVVGSEIAKVEKKFLPQRKTLERRRQVNSELLDQCTHDEAVLAVAKEKWDLQKQSFEEAQQNHLKELDKLKASIESSRIEHKRAEKREQEAVEAHATSTTTFKVLREALSEATRISNELQKCETTVLHLRQDHTAIRTTLEALDGRHKAQAQQEVRLEEAKAMAVKAKNYKEAARLQTELKTLKEDRDAAQQELQQLQQRISDIETELVAQTEIESQLKAAMAQAKIACDLAKLEHFISSHRRLHVHLQSALDHEDFDSATFIQKDIEAIVEEVRAFCQTSGLLMPELANAEDLDTATNDADQSNQNDHSDDNQQPQQQDEPIDVVDGVHDCVGTENSVAIEANAFATNDDGNGGDDDTPPAFSFLCDTAAVETETDVQGGDAEPSNDADMLEAAPVPEPQLPSIEEIQAAIAELDSRINIAVETENYELADELNAELEAKQALLSQLQPPE
eukprot:c15959_g1_i1.p1 GENE.c15959_g1_i1~~c15959_g1_i1.p1  ORF type:complete len:894 (-),score=286.33 c15959_g1_i1:253-2811(-)